MPKAQSRSADRQVLQSPDHEKAPDSKGSGEIGFPASTGRASSNQDPSPETRLQELPKRMGAISECNSIRRSDAERSGRLFERVVRFMRRPDFRILIPTKESATLFIGASPAKPSRIRLKKEHLHWSQDSYLLSIANSEPMGVLVDC